jgi:hypothetical protein
VHEVSFFDALRNKEKLLLKPFHSLDESIVCSFFSVTTFNHLFGVELLAE